MIKDFFKRPRNRFISEVVTLAVVFGFAAGLVGQLIATVYFDPWRSYIEQDTLATSVTTAVPELRKNKKVLRIEQDFEINDVVTKNAPTVVSLFLKKNITGTVLDPTDAIGSGVIVTSDGWIISHHSAVSAPTARQAVVVYANKTYPIEQLIEDQMTGVTFLKINAANLPVVAFGDSNEISRGQLAVSVTGQGATLVTTIREPHRKTVNAQGTTVRSTEQYFETILLNTALEAGEAGSPLLNLAGEVTGIITTTNTGGQLTAVPVNQFRLIVVGVLKNGAITRPFLGLEYSDLSELVPADATASTDVLTAGALVTRTPQRTTPAGTAGLQVKDVITRVDDEAVDADSSLTELLQQYQPGATLTLTVMRAGKQIEVPVVLASQPQ